MKANLSLAPLMFPARNKASQVFRIGTALACVTIFLSATVWAEEFTGKVSRISDGDTLAVNVDGEIRKVRLAGIDAPEKAMPHGQDARRSLTELTSRQTVRVVYEKQDRYGRIIGKVLLLDGKDICLTQVQLGMAWHYVDFAREQTPEDRQQYAQAEQRAKAAKLGLWREASPTPPWDWRRSRLAQPSDSDDTSITAYDFGDFAVEWRASRSKDEKRKEWPLGRLFEGYELYTGPRGGVYYYTEKGEKRYVSQDR